jgi:phage regulator Rha-like protein
MPKKITTLAASPVAVEVIEQRIYLVRGHKVMLDSDLAELYGVETKGLNRAVRRNLARFPADFMFELTHKEGQILRYHFGTSSAEHGGRRYLPYVFTEQGVAMLSSILKSERAVQVNIAIMRAFMRVRSILAEHKELARKIEALEKSYESQSHKYDAQFKVIFDAIRKLLEPPLAPPRRRIGFHSGGK